VRRPEVGGCSERRRSGLALWLMAGVPFRLILDFPHRERGTADDAALLTATLAQGRKRDRARWLPQGGSRYPLPLPWLIVNGGTVNSAKFPPACAGMPE
jgi:hypothetical protein